MLSLLDTSCSEYCDHCVIVIVENYESHCLVLPNTAASSIVTLWLEVFFHDSIYGTAVYC